MLPLKKETNYDTSFPSYKRTENLTKNELHSLSFLSPVNSNVNLMNLTNFYDNINLNYINSITNIDLLNEKNRNFNGSQKKTLVLDLDETLVHSAMTPFPYKDNIVLTINFEGKKYTIYVIKRPFLDTFFNEISNFYDIIIFTASIGQYSDLLLKFIDKKGVVKIVLNRDHCNYYEGCYFKDLRIINKDFKDIIIIDNNPISYIWNKENGIPIKSWFDDPNDNELIKLIPFLKLLSKVNDVRPFIKSAINQKSGQLDFSYINKLQDNVNKLNSILSKNFNNENNINLNTSLMNNSMDNSNENKAELNPNMGLIINNNNRINKNTNNINLINKMNININNNFEKINIIYNNDNKFNSKTLNQNVLGKEENRKNSARPNLNEKEKKNNYNKIHVENITNKNLKTLDEKNKRNNIIVKKLNNINSYQKIYVEKSPNTNLNIYQKNCPIYSKYDSGKSHHQDGIEENKMDNENKTIIQRGSYMLLQNNNDYFIPQDNTHLLQKPNLNNYKKIKKSKPLNRKELTEDSHTIREKANNDSNISKFKNLNEELTKEKLQEKFITININNNTINKVNSNMFQNTYFKNINSKIKETPLRVKTPEYIRYKTFKVNSIKPKKLFNDSKQINNNNYHLTKNDSLSCRKNRIIVMKIIRTNSKRTTLGYSSNESKFNLTNNSIKDNKNVTNNSQKFKKINLKLNKNIKSNGYLYNPFDSIFNLKNDKYETNKNILLKKTHKNTDINNNFGLSQMIFQKLTK
jgi:Dullard-like phosphatase family protein